MKKGRIIPMKSCRKIISNGECGISAEIGSAGFGGPDENSQAYLKITDLGAGFKGKVNRCEDGELDSLELSIRGDDGIIMLMDALDFLTKALVQIAVEDE